MIKIYIYALDKNRKFIISNVIEPWKNTRHIDEDFEIMDFNDDPKKANLIIIDGNINTKFNRVNEFYTLAICQEIPCIVFNSTYILDKPYLNKLNKKYSKLTIGVLLEDFVRNCYNDYINKSLCEHHIFDITMTMIDFNGDGDWKQTPEILMEALDDAKTIIDYIYL